MKYVEVLAESSSRKTLTALATKVKVEDARFFQDEGDNMLRLRLLVSSDRLQSTLDALENVLGAQPSAKVVVLDVEAVWPSGGHEQQDKEHSATESREALLEGVSKNAVCNRNYVVLVMLSTVVAAIGLMENNVAVVIGAMVIAPLLGPNLALSLGISLGDLGLVRKALFASVVGVSLAIVISLGMGLALPMEEYSDELLTRTRVGISSAALALASGAAAALSLTTGLSSVLVGVMVAVALLPPAATLGIMIGQGESDLALGAGLLLAVNVVCVDLAGNLVFWLKKIRPRNPRKKTQAVRATVICISGWLITLAILLLAVHLRKALR